jgi:hypothetical protein
MNARSVVSQCAVYFVSVVLNSRNHVSHTDTVSLKIVVYCIVLEAWFLHLCVKLHVLSYFIGPDAIIVPCENTIHLVSIDVSWVHLFGK